jgi:hypothetical protein
LGTVETREVKAWLAKIASIATSYNQATDRFSPELGTWGNLASEKGTIGRHVLENAYSKALNPCIAPDSVCVPSKHESYMPLVNDAPFG